MIHTFRQGGKRLVQRWSQIRELGTDGLGRSRQGHQHRLIQPDQLILVQIPEQSGGGEQHIPSLLAGGVVTQRQPLQSLDDATGIPHWFDTEQIEAKGHHHTLITDRIRGPQDQGIAAFGLLSIQGPGFSSQFFGQ